MKKAILTATVLAAAMAAAPASASIYTYTQTNGDVLTINTATNSGTLIGNSINASFSSKDLSGFTGGANPSGSFVLESLDGYRVSNGKRYTDTPTHTQKLIISDDGRTNLWSHWGPDRNLGDYITQIDTFTPPAPQPPSSTGGTGSSSGGSTGGTDVPAPGMVLLFGAGAAALAYRRRRNKKVD